MATTFRHALRTFVAPSLPIPPEQYTRLRFDTFNNVLRLYFNQIDSTVGAMIGGTGGSYLSFPYAAVQRTTDFNFVTANTPTRVTFNQNDFLNGCANPGTAAGRNGIQVDYTGIYNYQFSVQFANTDSQAHAAFIWLKVNGTDYAGTGSKFDVPSKHGASDGYLIAACNFYVSLDPSDTVELWAAATQVENGVTDGVYMEAYAANAAGFTMPAIPSVVATLTYVSTQPTA